MIPTTGCGALSDLVTQQRDTIVARHFERLKHAADAFTCLLVALYERGEFMRTNDQPVFVIEFGGEECTVHVGETVGELFQPVRVTPGRPVAAFPVALSDIDAETIEEAAWLCDERGFHQVAAELRRTRLRLLPVDPDDKVLDRTTTHTHFPPGVH